MSITRRKDNKGRVLNENEFQKSDGRYEYSYRDLNGKSRSVYSWKLTASDRLPKGSVNPFGSWSRSWKEQILTA